MDPEDLIRRLKGALGEVEHIQSRQEEILAGFFSRVALELHEQDALKDHLANIFQPTWAKEIGRAHV